MNLPTDQEILALHEKYAPHQAAFDIVWSHSQITAGLASELITTNNLNVDTRLVQAAAMLHDIGYYPLFDHSGYVPREKIITHGVTGAELLRREHLDEAICRIAERHTGVGLTKHAIIDEKLPLPARDLVAKTPEERLVMYADKFHSKAIGAHQNHDSLGWFNSPATYLAYTSRFHVDNTKYFRELVAAYGVPDLTAWAERYHEKLK
jgi:uncharacterized protein